MLPTLAFILAAYLILACYNVWPRRRTHSFRSRPWWRRPSRLAVLGVLAGAGLGMAAWLGTSPGEPEQKFKLSGFLGMSWADTWASDKPSKRVEALPYRDQGQGAQPAYALLHPEVPASQAAPAKKPPVSRALQKPKAKQPAKTVKVAKAATPAPAKKEKPTAKSKVKKKKPSPPPAIQRAAAD